MRTNRPLIATAAAAVALALGAAPAASAAPSTDSLMPAPADCGVDPQRIAAETPAPHPGSTWTVGQTGNVCGNLGYVFLETAGGTATSPTQVVLLHRGQKVATQPAGGHRVLLGGASDAHVQLRVQQPPAPGRPNAEATYTTTTYVWNPIAGDATPLPFGS